MRIYDEAFFLEVMNAAREVAEANDVRIERDGRSVRRLVAALAASALAIARSADGDATGVIIYLDKEGKPTVSVRQGVNDWREVTPD